MDRLDRRSVWAVGFAAAGIQVMSGQSWLAFYVLFPIASIAMTVVDHLFRWMWRMAANATA